jgi:deoxyribodipyrimidine photo-lyase
LRMIAAMFLTKDLDTHWVLGERYFMRMLVDYDQASNVGGWQWAASTGTDAAPYFRVMNPVLQSEKFDPEGEFLRHYLPELAKVPAAFVHAPWEMPAEVQRECGCVIGRDYPGPVVDHAAAKGRAIAKFKRKT